MSLVSAGELAEALGVTASWVYRWKRDLPHDRLPSGHLRFDLDRVRLTLARNGHNYRGMGRPRGSGSGSVRHHRGGYEARATVDGRRATRRFKTKAEALDWLATVRLTGRDACQGRGQNLADVIDSFLKDREPRWKPASQAHHRAMLKGETMFGAVHGSVPFLKLTRRILQTHFNARLKDYAYSTVRQELRILREVWNWAVREDLTVENLAKEVELPKPPQKVPRRTLAPDEIFALIDVAEGPYRMAWLLAFAAGLRRTEILRATWEWVFLASDVLVVMEGKTGQHKIPLASWLRDELAAAGVREGPLVPGANKSKLRYHLELDLERAGIDATGVTMHTLRRSLGTLLDANGTPYGIVQFLLRHRIVDVTGYYIIPSVETSRPHLERLVALVQAAANVRRMKTG